MCIWILLAIHNEWPNKTWTRQHQSFRYWRWYSTSYLRTGGGGGLQNPLYLSTSNGAAVAWMLRGERWNLFTSFLAQGIESELDILRKTARTILFLAARILFKFRHLCPLPQRRTHIQVNKWTHSGVSTDYEDIEFKRIPGDSALWPESELQPFSSTSRFSGLFP